MIKKILTVLSAVVCTMAFAVPEYGITVGSTSTKIAPERDVKVAAPWVASMPVAQGQLVKQDGLLFMAETAKGSSTVAPGLDATFRRLASNPPRSSVVVCNASTNVVWINIGNAAVLNKGIRVAAGWTVELIGVQAAVYAISSADSLVTGVDLPAGR